MKKDDEIIQRRSLMTGVGAAALAGLVAGGVPATASAQSGNAGFTPARHDEDAWFDVPGVTHRVFIDSASAQGGQDALRFAFNIMNAHQAAYAGSDADYAMVVCYRHASTPFGYGDALWEKYGELLNRRMNLTDPATNATPVRNINNISGGPFSGATIDAMVARGVRFAICAMATRGMAGLIAGETGQQTDAVFNEIVAGAIPNARFVPAGVMGATRAQEYGYSLLSAG